MEHVLGLVANGTIALAYLAIFALVTNGLVQSRHPRNNVLAAATAAIFASCGVGHGLHLIHLAEGMDPGYDWHLGLWDGLTAFVAVGYLSLRKRYGMLIDDGRMFEDRHRIQAERDFRTAFEGAPIGMALVALDGRLLRVNPALCRILGRRADEMLVADFQALTHPDDLEADLELFGEVLAGGRPGYQMEKRYLRPDGSHVTARLSVSLVRDADGEPLHLISQVEDVSAEHAAHDAARRSDQLFTAAFAGAPVAMAVLDPATGRVQRANDALFELLGQDECSAGAFLAAAVHPEDREALLDAQRLALQGAEPVQTELRVLRADGQVAASLVALARVDHAERPLLIVHVLDVTERKRFERQLQHLAEHDALTGLPNRRRFEDELTRVLSHQRRYGTTGALLLLDLDGFKYVNDTLGHAVGDELITRVGGLLASVVRESDFLARLGGDEFAIILPEADPATAAVVADKALECVRDHAVIVTADRHARVTASIGIAMLDHEDLSAEDALVDADLAMYEAKEEGRGCWRLSDDRDEHRARVSTRAHWADRLRVAVAEERLELIAQPIFGIHAAEAERYELLLRYRDDTGDLVPPGIFLYIAERFDLIAEIDRWVLSQAIVLLSRLHREGRDVGLHVNLSGRTFKEPGLVDCLREAADAHPIPPGRLVVEVTETAAIVNLRHAQDFADELHRLGCRFALDDFGAGFASFYYLKHLRFDVLKIDGEFIKRLPHTPTDQLVVAAIVDIARGMGTETVAECVEDEATLEVLQRLGVDYAQGFHLGRPARLSTLGLQAAPAAG